MKSPWHSAWGRWMTMWEKLLLVELSLPRPHSPSLSLWICLEGAAVKGLNGQGVSWATCPSLPWTFLVLALTVPCSGNSVLGKLEQLVALLRRQAWIEGPWGLRQRWETAPPLCSQSHGRTKPATHRRNQICFEVKMGTSSRKAEPPGEIRGTQLLSLSLWLGIVFCKAFDLLVSTVTKNPLAYPEIGI